MPRLLARLIPAIVIASVVYTLYLLIRFVMSSETKLSKQDRTRLIFAAIIAAVSIVIMFSITISGG